MKKQLYRAAAATVLGLSLTTGIVAADTGNISNTGPDSSNHVTAHTRVDTDVTNHNHVWASNDNDQSAYTGRAGVYHNTTGGSATSGSAMNSNGLSATVAVDNSSSSGSGSGVTTSSASGSIDHSGPNSDNSVRSTTSIDTDITNYNDVSVRNDNDQHASSGSATVADNTTGGNATSGNASNTNSSTFDLSVTN